MLISLILLAQEEAAKKGGDPPSMLVQFMPIILIVVVFYFLIILPGRKERQQRAAMITALKKNDKVITNAGIVGQVVNLIEGTEEVTIKSEDTKLRILRSSIARVMAEPAATGDAKPV
ncbi:MAG: preprotein translocase subunit YajC [Gemmataceae bacterium]|nr:preprotein translocase subunit YajC [Gemmataceae bacterium]MCI0738572.1 preprotein translocase subunit YajC [Gemmataceae bacterium]